MNPYRDSLGRYASPFTPAERRVRNRDRLRDRARRDPDLVRRWAREAQRRRRARLRGKRPVRSRCGYCLRPGHWARYCELLP